MTSHAWPRPSRTALPRLSRTALPVAGLKLPPPLPEPGIVHLGLGNFHRAHQAVYTADALRHSPGPWGITGVSTSAARGPRPVLTGMAEQDRLYTVLTLRRDAGVAATVPGVHHPGLVADGQGAEVVAAIGSSTTRIVSVTVTEKGTPSAQTAASTSTTRWSAPTSRAARPAPHSA